MRIFISAGEVSGDIAGALVTRAILEQRPGTEVIAFGGERMAAAGATIAFQSNHLGTVGITETIAALRHYPRAFSAMRRLMRERRPDVAVLIANDVFHTVLARWLRRHGIRTVAYFPPQVWVWRALIRPIAHSFDTILTSFPEEHDVYEHAGGRTGVAFVGHYLTDVLHARTREDITHARERLAVSDTVPLVAVMPGSRAHEVTDILPQMLGAADRLLQVHRDVRFVLPIANARHRPEIERQLARTGSGLRVQIVDGSTRDALVASDVLIVASGTATLEATILGVPMVIVYKLSPITAALVYGCIRVGLIDSDTVGLPNRIMGSKVVPELLQSRADSAAIAREVSELLTSPERRATMTAALAEATRRIARDGVAGSVAAHVIAGAQSPPVAGAPLRS